MPVKMNNRSSKVKTPLVTDKVKPSDSKRKHGDDRRFSKTRSVTNRVRQETNLKENSQGSEQTLGGSMANPPADNCSLTGSKSQVSVPHVSECDEQIRGHHAAHFRKQDNTSQVVATDIQSSVNVQTSPSLLLQGKELPLIRPGPLRMMTAHKHTCSCDCEQSPWEPIKQFVHNDTQTEAWQVSGLEYTQTGPSLTAVGPFSRLDYRLRKTQLCRDDMYVNCCPTTCGLSETISGSKKWLLCPSVDQQVSPLDIGVSELLQTEDYPRSGDEYGHVICEKCLGQTHKTIYKEQSLMDCECPLDWDKSYVAKINKGFSTQVAQEDISPTKCTQTDLCLWVDACKKTRLYPSGYWICGFRQLCQSLPGIRLKSVTDFSQQVSATDIGISEETQTCQHLMLAKPFCSTCSRSRKCNQGGAQRVLTGRSGSFLTDRCEACRTSSKAAAVLDASTQVKPSDNSFSKEQQTCEESSNKTKCFIRRGQWASKTWH